MLGLRDHGNGGAAACWSVSLAEAQRRVGGLSPARVVAEFTAEVRRGEARRDVTGEGRGGERVQGGPTMGARSFSRFLRKSIELHFMSRCENTTPPPRMMRTTTARRSHG